MPDFAPLDRIDFALLGALQNDAAQSNKELAALVGLAPSSCLERVRRLRARGALRGIHADVNPSELGIGLEAMIAVRLRQHSRDLVDSFETHVGNLPETVNVFHVAGVDDFLVHVAVRDTAHLRTLTLDSFTCLPEVDRLETSVIFSHRPSHALPIYP